MKKAVGKACFGFERMAERMAEVEQGAIQKRIAFTVEGRQPVREGGRILDAEGNEIGRVTSGGFSPSLEAPIGLGYVATALAEVRLSPKNWLS